jgi:hypothetical protein
VSKRKSSTPTQPKKETPVNTSSDPASEIAPELISVEVAAGTDSIEGGADQGSIAGAEGSDSVVTSEGTDSVEGSDGSDSVEGATGEGTDSVTAGSGDDAVQATTAPVSQMTKVLSAYAEKMAVNKPISLMDGINNQRYLREGMMQLILGDDEALAIKSLKEAADYMAKDTSKVFTEEYLFRFYDNGKPAIWTDPKVRKEMETVLTFIINARSPIKAMRSQVVMDMDAIAKQCLPINGELIVRRLKRAFVG